MPLNQFTAKYFLGRKNELDILKRVALDAKSGDATSIFLSGKRGVGKTELLKHLCNYLFNGQDESIPFLYTIKTAFSSVTNFSKDYLSSFILQCLAFLKRDASLKDSGIHSFDDLIYIASKAEIRWIVDMIDKYLQFRENGDPVKLFTFAISAPYHCYKSSGLPVVVMLDDFHKMRRFCEFNDEDGNRHFWMLFEKQFNSWYTPHIISGYQAELHKMFFEETSFGENLEIINLPSLSKNDSIKLFRLLSEKYALKFEIEVSDYIDFFNGTPFYIKSFVQAARQAGKSFNSDDFWEVYFTEVTRGKIYSYWTSLLKSYVPQFELRKPSLNFLRYLDNIDNTSDIVLSDVSEELSIKDDKLDRVMDILHSSGTIEMGFSTIKLADDEILIDVIKGLYHREIARRDEERIKEEIIGYKRQRLKDVKALTFKITIPSAHKAELVAVRSLEQIAGYYNISPETTGQLQFAMVELFANVFAKDGSPTGEYEIKFERKENIFSVEIITSQKEFVLSDDDSERVKAYLDDLRIEEVVKGTKITLFKELKEDFVSA
jgi:energy-coupling factor transporter ATP-binding protein EcfA2